MIGISSLRPLLLLLPLLFLSACSEDDPVEPIDFGSSPVTFVHANPGRGGDVVSFFRNDTVSLGAPIGYKNNLLTTVPNGTSRKYTVKAGDGTTLRTKVGGHDSSEVATVVYAGNATTNDLFVLETTKVKPAGDNAALRFVHASKSATRRELRIGGPNGAPIADIGYGEASNAYVTAPATSTTSLWVVDELIDPDKNNREFPVSLTGGKSYTIIFIGNDSALVDNLKWDLLVLEDPE